MPHHITGHKSSSHCKSMEDVRTEVDRIDSQLIPLLAERQSYLDAASAIKTDRSAVRDSARIEDVVTKILHQAEHHGLNASIAEPVWRTLIERSIAYEFKAWDRRNSD